MYSYVFTPWKYSINAYYLGQSPIRSDSVITINRLDHPSTLTNCWAYFHANYMKDPLQNILENSIFPRPKDCHTPFMINENLMFRQCNYTSYFASCLSGTWANNGHYDWWKEGSCFVSIFWSCLNQCCEVNRKQRWILFKPLWKWNSWACERHALSQLNEERDLSAKGGVSVEKSSVGLCRQEWKEQQQFNAFVIYGVRTLRKVSF